VVRPDEEYEWIWTREDEFRKAEHLENPGSTPVSGVGESVSLSRTSEDQNSFRRDAETHARDGRAPQTEEAWYGKRRLPHFEKPWTIYAITASTRTRRKLSPAGRTIVLSALRHFHLDRYELFAACVMPDHVHFLFQPWPKEQGAHESAVFWSVSELTHSVKSFTAHEINKPERSRGPIWEEEVFDRYIRSESDLHEKFRYICRNPWDSKVVRPDEEYEWIWTREDEFRKAELLKNPGSTPVPGVGESVSLSRTSDERSFRRDAETHARDGRAPQTVSAQRAMKSSTSTRPPALD
jgi:REP element-mobilizing transposase RayT